jgi:hypothetical protein
MLQAYVSSVSGISDVCFSHDVRLTTTTTTTTLTAPGRGVAGLDIVSRGWSKTPR